MPEIETAEPEDDTFEAEIPDVDETRFSQLPE